MRKGIVVIVVGTTLMAAAANASVVTMYASPSQVGNSLTWDTANVTNRATTSGTAAYTVGGGLTDLHNENLTPAIPPQHVRPSMLVNTDTTYAAGTGFNRGATSAGYYSFQGNLGIRGSLSVGWAAPDNTTLGSSNGAGADLAIMEWSNNEGFLVRVQDTLSGQWSGWRYTPASWAAADTAGTTYRTWVTLLDYSSFGISSGGSVQRVEMMSILAGDAGTGGNGTGLDANGYAFDPFNPTTGTIFNNPQHGGAFTNGPIMPYYTTSDVTADIWYVVSLNSLVPAPSALAVVGLSGLTLVRRRRA
ncbi:MAG: hypothetical protein ACREJO_01795 [Phycisphaerales bacterium]